MPDLSIVIPARNEEFLTETVDDICRNIEGDTEVIVVLDGQWPVKPINNNPRVKIIFFPESVGQRAATNYGVSLSRAKYIMKCDAHCAFDKGFDVKMMKLMEDDITMVPIMRNLHAFDWVCPNGHRRYQGPSGVCKECGAETTKDIVWIPKTNPQSTAYRFDTDLHFQYWNEFGKAQKGDLTETMSIQGSCFMLTRDKYWELNICDEAFGSWGQQGVEVACKTWLSGGRVLTNRTTWYAHLFRTQGGDFGFPYPQSGTAIQKARDFSKDLFLKGGFKSKYDFDWLLKKFNPPGWVKKGIIYYTDNQLNMKLAKKVREQISKSGLPIVSCTLKPTKFGKNFVIDEPRGYKTMFKQILKALEESDADIVYFCEHDVLYHPDHFTFTPKEDKFYYNGNYWMVRKDGFSIHYDVSPLSGLVCYRESAIKHFKERLALIEKQGFGYYMGFEPFTHGRIKWDFWRDFEIFMPENPNIDISHDGNLTKKRWSQDKFIRKPKFWEESTIDQIKGWDNLKSIY
jgi:glycosyltransferase involved in cell wall biosynthesis